MKKFIVKIDNLCTSLLEIEAETKDDARARAKDFFEHNRNFVLSLKDYYTSTTPSDMWPIIDKKDFEDLQHQLYLQGRAKEKAALLIHRADLIDQRLRIRNRKSLIGTIEEYLLTKDLLAAEKRVQAEGIVLDDATKQEIDKLIENDIYNKNNLYKYMDPDACPWKIGDLIVANEQAKIRMESNKIINETNFLEDRDKFPEDYVQEMADKAKQRALELKAERSRQKNKGNLSRILNSEEQ